MKEGLGYRQRAALKVLEGAGHPVPTGQVVRALFPDEPDDWTARKTTSVALDGLRRRGLVDRVHRGWWRAA